MSGLRGRAIRAALTNVIGQVLTLIVSFVGTVACSRILGPAVFGQFAIILVVVGFFAFIAEVGSSWVLVQIRDIRPDHIATAALMLSSLALGGMGIVLAVAFILPAEVLPTESRSVLLASIVIVLLQAMCGLPRALLRRALRAKASVLADLLGTLVGVSVGISLAGLGFGLWSLLYQVVVTRALQLAILFVSTRDQYHGRPTLSAFRDLLQYSSVQVFYEVALYLARNIDTLLVGRFFGTTALGLYNRAFSLTQQPVGQFYSSIGTVALSTFSKVQGEPNLTGVAHRSIALAVSVVGLPVASIVLVNAEPLLILLFGPDWTNAAPLMQIMIIGAILQLYFANLLWVSQANRRLKRQSGAGAIAVVSSFCLYFLGVWTGELSLVAAAYPISYTVSIVWIAPGLTEYVVGLRAIYAQVLRIDLALILLLIVVPFALQSLWPAASTSSVLCILLIQISLLVFALWLFPPLAKARKELTALLT